MAKENQKKKEKKVHYSDYPIGALFQFSILCSAVSCVALYLRDPSDLASIVYRSFLVFIGIAVSGGLVMVLVFVFLSMAKEREEDERRKILEQTISAELQAQSLTNTQHTETPQ